MSDLNIYFDTDVVLHINLYDNPFVQKWKELLQEELTTKSILQTDTFSFFMTEEESQKYLVDAITVVNGFLKHEFIAIPNGNDFVNANYYNDLHIKFEQLSGPDWDKPTKLILIAPPEVRLAIKHINRFCHRLEQRPYSIEPLLRVEFDTHKRIPLEPEDYEYFDKTMSGSVYLDYSTLGKSLYDLYEDNLPVDYKGLKMQQHYAANFIVKFEEPTQRKPSHRFKSWLELQGINPSSISNTGHIPLGNIVEPNHFDLIVKSRKINKITLE
jgi:hypothetical protein